MKIPMVPIYVSLAFAVLIFVLSGCQAYDPEKAKKTVWVPIHGIPSHTPLEDPADITPLSSK